MMLLSRPKENEVEFRGQTLRFKRCPATVGMARERIVGVITGKADRVEIEEADFRQMIQDIARFLLLVDGRPAKEAIGDDIAAVLDEDLTALDVVSIWSTWYSNSVLDPETAKKSHE